MTAIGDAIAGPPAVLATVVSAEGSAYRRPGAKMLVTPSCDRVGSVTAGCAEDKVHELADAVLASGDTRLERFDLSSGDALDFGIGCNGAVDILLEPLTGRYQRVVDSCRSGVDSRS